MYWINDPSAYYMDGSYYQVEYPAVGDIVCYFDITGENIHSGIVVDKTSETFPVDGSMTMLDIRLSAHISNTLNSFTEYFVRFATTFDDEEATE